MPAWRPKALRKRPLCNLDWEDLAEDGQGTVFVDDAGNNANTRRDLAVYRVPRAAGEPVGKICFRYPDQTAFPPSKAARNFDCEALLWHAGKLYLFTRDRGQQRTSKVYTLPDQPGTYTATLLTTLPLSGQLTGVDLSPDGRTLALLGREALTLYTGTDLAKTLRPPPAPSP